MLTWNWGNVWLLGALTVAISLRIRTKREKFSTSSPDQFLAIQNMNHLFYLAKADVQNSHLIDNQKVVTLATL